MARKKAEETTEEVIKPVSARKSVTLTKGGMSFALSDPIMISAFENQGYDKDTEYDMDVKTAEELNAKGQVTHPELSPFFERINEEKAAKADK